MIDHLGINCADYPKSQQFYDTVLGTIGFSRQLDFGRAIGYGRDGHPAFWISDGAGMGPNRENHIAFEALAPISAQHANHRTCGAGCDRTEDAESELRAQHAGDSFTPG